MNNLKVLISAILLLSATIFITQSVFAADKSMSATNASLAASPTVKELVMFVESAAAYAKENGKDKAFEEFNNKTGPFVKGDLYIYAADFNGTHSQMDSNLSVLAKTGLMIQILMVFNSSGIRSTL